MAEILGKTTLGEDAITVFADGNDYLRVARDVGPTNKKISAANLKKDFSGNESDTIDASGEITISNVQPVNLMSVDTFGAAASDNLDTINGGHAGQLIILQAADTTHTVVIRDNSASGTGSIFTAGGAAFSLDNIEDKWVGVVVSSGVIHEVSRSNNG